ncbi:MAG: hypothetical protein OJI67_20965 [Prosthecobacter sp.]|nr:hypothetical protein [Prosthecobacter sp.]
MAASTPENKPTPPHPHPYVSHAVRPHFSLGTLSAGACTLFIVLLSAWGMVTLYLIPLLVYAVPCRAGLSRKPRHLWLPFTLISIALAAGLAYQLTFHTPMSDGETHYNGYPIRRPENAPWNTDPLHLAALLNLTLISGLTLLPLSLTTTLLRPGSNE